MREVTKKATTLVFLEVVSLENVLIHVVGDERLQV